MPTVDDIQLSNPISSANYVELIAISRKRIGTRIFPTDNAQDNLVLGIPSILAGDGATTNQGFWETIFTDDFPTDAQSELWGDITGIMQHTREASAWQAVDGLYEAPQQLGDPATQSWFAQTLHFVRSMLPWPLRDYVIEVDITNPQDCGIWLFSQSPRSGIVLTLGGTSEGKLNNIAVGGSLVQAGSVFWTLRNDLQRMIRNEVPNQVASFGADTTYHVKVIAVGGRYSVYIDDQLISKIAPGDSILDVAAVGPEAGGFVGLWAATPQGFNGSDIFSNFVLKAPIGFDSALPPPIASSAPPEPPPPTPSAKPAVCSSNSFNRVLIYPSDITIDSTWASVPLAIDRTSPIADADGAVDDSSYYQGVANDTFLAVLFSPLPVTWEASADSGPFLTVRALTNYDVQVSIYVRTSTQTTYDFVWAGDCGFDLLDTEFQTAFVDLSAVLDSSTFGTYEVKAVFRQLGGGTMDPVTQISSAILGFCTADTVVPVGPPAITLQVYTNGTAPSNQIIVTPNSPFVLSWTSSNLDHLVASSSDGSFASRIGTNGGTTLIATSSQTYTITGYTATDRAPAVIAQVSVLVQAPLLAGATIRAIGRPSAPILPADGFLIIRELYDPMVVSDVAGLARLRNLIPSAYVPFKRDYLTGVLTEVGNTTAVNIRDSIVLVHSDLATDYDLQRVAQYLVDNANILPARLL